jgi:nitrate reductase delta subunit
MKTSKLSRPMSLSLRVLARLLSYPDDALREHLDELRQALRSEAELQPARLAEVETLIDSIATQNAIDAEADYVQLFDSGRRTSLHLFEHVHGDSRERGPALVDLQQTYERAGLLLQDSGELPDHLPIVLEFASTQPPKLAREFLGEIAHILTAVFSALRERDNAYASVIAAVLEIAGQRVQAVPVAADPSIDEAWAEPPAFDGCSTRGQARPDTPQPIQIVRRTASPQHQGAQP